MREPALDRSTLRKQLLLALGIALVPYALLVARFDFVCDDAFISFRYAQHLAHGRGLTFNPHESPPVEGFTNLLWVVWLALFERIGVDVALAARASSIACGGLLVALVTRFAQRAFDLRATATVAVALFTATLSPIVLWSTSGLETMPFALSTFAIFERLSLDPERPRGVRAGIAAALAALLRADGALWAAAILLAAWLGVSERERRRSLLRASLVAAALLLATVIANVLGRHAYFGEWLPNTARVKAGMSVMRLERGAKYVASFLLAVPVCWLVLLGALALRVKETTRFVLQAGFVIAFATLYALYVGGDFMPMGRFFVPAMPFVAIAFAAGVTALLARMQRRFAMIFASACILLALLPSFDVGFVPASVREALHFRWNDPRVQTECEMWRSMRDRAQQWEMTGRALALHTRPGESIVLSNIGAISYFTELHVYDLFGLVSPEVARREAPLARASPGHDKGVSPEFFLDRKPDYLGAWIARADSAVDEGLPRAWMNAAWARSVVLERHPLRVQDGFPPELELRVLRFHWSE